MFTRLGLLLIAASLAGCVSQRAEESRVPTSFSPEMERFAEIAANAWRACLARSFPSHVRRGLDADSAAEAALASCITEERSYVLVGIRAGIPAHVAQQSMQFIRHEQKQLMLRAYQQAAAGVAAQQPQPAARPEAAARPRPRLQPQRPAPARRPAPRDETLTPLVPAQ